MWEITDTEHYVLTDLEWKGNKSIENFVGCMEIRHPKEKHVDIFLNKYGVPSTTSSQQRCISPRINRNGSIVEDLPTNNVSMSPLRNKSTRNLAIAIPAEETIYKNPKSSDVSDQHAKNQPTSKQCPRQLPLSKNRSANASSKASAQIYFHAVFTTYPRHKLPKDMTSHKSIILDLFNQLPQKPKFDSQSRWNSTIASWNSSGKALCPLYHLF